MNAVPAAGAGAAAWRSVEGANLRTRNSFGVVATAARLVELDDARALPALLEAPGIAGEPLMVLGGGSNLLFAGDPPGVLLHLTGAGVTELGNAGDHVLLRAEAGADWHAFVLHTLAQGLCGLENLALIPGTVGAAPIQNIGAYGVEVADRIDAVEAFDRQSASLVRLDRTQCAFAYRDSLFKRAPERYIVLAVVFALSRVPRLHLDYAGLREELQAMAITEPTAAQVADAVVRIRRRKLPDPAVIGNAGSFFKNPIVPIATAARLQALHPALPVFRGADPATRKLSAAWMIDACGWKGVREGDAGVSPVHALVLVNHGAASGKQLLDLARRIAASVGARFGIAIEPEPRIIGARW